MITGESEARVRTEINITNTDVALLQLVAHLLLDIRELLRVPESSFVAGKGKASK